MVLDYTKEAERDIDRIASFVLRDSPEAAERFLRSVRLTARSLLEFPLRGRERRRPQRSLRDLRWIAVRGFPRHLIFYRASPDLLLVVRVLPGVMNLDQILGSEGPRLAQCVTPPASGSPEPGSRPASAAPPAPSASWGTAR